MSEIDLQHLSSASRLYLRGLLDKVQLLSMPSAEEREALRKAGLIHTVLLSGTDSLTQAGMRAARLLPRGTILG